MGYVEKEIEGMPMLLRPDKPGISKELCDKGGREFCFMWLLREYSKGCAVAYDVGANIGYTTMALAQNANRVHAFEPDKRSFKILQDNLYHNDITNVYLHKTAVWDTCGEIGFDAAAKPNVSSISHKAKHKVQCETLDSYIKFREEPVFIKMDVEGAEAGVLRGAKKLLTGTNACRILVELHPQKYDNGENDFYEIMCLLRSWRFNVRFVVNAKGWEEHFTRHYKLVKKFPNYKRHVWHSREDTEEFAVSVKNSKMKPIRSMMWERR